MRRRQSVSMCHRSLKQTTCNETEISTILQRHPCFNPRCISALYLLINQPRITTHNACVRFVLNTPWLRPIRGESAAVPHNEANQTDEFVVATPQRLVLETCGEQGARRHYVQTETKFKVYIYLRQQNIYGMTYLDTSHKSTSKKLLVPWAIGKVKIC